MVEVKRKKGESFENFLRRFNRTLQQSRKLHHARQIRYYLKKENKNKRREKALISLKLRAEREYLRKIGKLKEEPRRRW
ncbi:30S ribosomal protein S21 [Candidatus Parcubacteria bacterium]|nr:MAG: 30S ribosomal protein S21 [Candidatus Parcubacteria bacterium]